MWQFLYHSILFHSIKSTIRWMNYSYKGTWYIKYFALSLLHCNFQQWSSKTIQNLDYNVYVTWPLYFPTRFKFYSSLIKTEACKIIQNYASCCSLLLLNLRCSSNYIYSSSLPPSSFPRCFGSVRAFIWRWRLLAKKGSRQTKCEEVKNNS